MNKEVMREAMLEEIPEEQRWSRKEHTVAFKRWELSVGESMSRCHKSNRQLPAETDPATFCSRPS